MILYSAVEFIIDPPPDSSAFVIHHLLHVALIGIAVWVASMIVIQRFVIEPVDQIFIHLRRVAAGRLEYLDCAVRAREVGDVVASVNGLVSRLRRVPEPNAVSEALDHLRGLREQLKASSDKLGDDVVPAMRLVTALEGDLLDILQQDEDSRLGPSPGSQRGIPFDAGIQSSTNLPVGANSPTP